MPKQSTATKTEKSTEKRHLKCILTEEEKKTLSEEIAQLISNKKSLQDTLKSVQKQYNADIQTAETQIYGNAEKIRAGYEIREVQCEVMIDRDSNQVTTTRLDTGEIIEERKLTFAERQTNLTAEIL